MFEIVLEVDGQEVSAHCRYRGSSTKPRVIGTLATIEGFTKKVGTAIRVGVKFDEKLLAQAHALHEALFHDEILSVFASIEATEPPLVRLIIEDSRLQGVPWEALCKPGTSEDFIAKGTRFSVARGISSDSAATRPIENALRLLVIAPQDHEAGLQSLRIALSEPIEHGSVEWLDPIRGQRATTFRIFDRLRTGMTPHVIHFIGHGSVDAAGHPILRLADDEDGDEVWIKAEELALELVSNFRRDLRLVVLEACEGAKPGIFGSAAEIFIRTGAEAVVSYLWPVRAASSREASKAFYRTLAAGQTGRGDVLASIDAARRSLLLDNAGGFSLVAHVRGETTKLFELTKSVGQRQSPFTVPFLQDKRFVGRRDDLEKLHTFLKQDAPIGVSALTGMGGIGKTQLAVEYAYRHRADYPGGVYWANAAADWQAELARLASKVGIRDLSSAEHERERWLARAFVEYLEQHTGSLLIFDNVEDPLELQNASRDIVPAQLPCRLLFTTRRQTPTFPMVDVRALDEEDALRLLLDTPTRRHLLEHGSAEDLATARSICKTLGYLPLAIVLASAHLDKSPRITLDGYLQGIAKHGALLVTDNAKVDPRELATQHAKAVRATLEEQWASLRGDNARHVLQTAAVLGEAEQIPRARLSLLTGLSDEPEDWRDAPLEEALRELSEYSLVETLTESVIRLHPLVREFAEWKLGTERESFAEACATRMADALYDMARLSNEVERRGVDEVLDDLRAGIGLGAHGQLGDLLRPMDREAHVLRNWKPTEWPGFFLQQLRNTCQELGIATVTELVERSLVANHTGWLQERFRVGNESPALVRTLVGHKGAVTAVAISADGRFVVSGSEDKTCRVWDFHAGRCVCTFVGHTGAVRAIAIATNSQLAISSSDDKTLRTWDVGTGREVRILAKPSLDSKPPLDREAFLEEAKRRVGNGESFLEILRERRANSRSHLILRGAEYLAIPPESDYVVTQSFSQSLEESFFHNEHRPFVDIWALQTGTLLRTLSIGSIVEVRNRTSVILKSQDGEFWECNPETGQCVSMFKWQKIEVDPLFTWQRTAVDIVAFSLDGGRALTVIRHSHSRGDHHLSTDRSIPYTFGQYTSHQRSTNLSKTITIWDIAQDKPICTLEGHTAHITSVYCTPDGRHVISASADKTMRKWEIETGRSIGTFRGHEGAVTRVCVTPNGRWAVSASLDCTIKVWDLEIAAVEPNARIGSDNVHALNGLAISPDGRIVVSYSRSGIIRIWNMQTGQALRTIEDDLGHLVGLSFFENGTAILCAHEDGTVRIWRTETGELLRTLALHDKRMSVVAAIANTPYAITAGDDDKINVWDTNSWRLVRQLEGHTDLVTSAAPLPNNHIITASRDKTLQIWDISRERPIRTLRGHTTTIRHVTTTPDGRLAISAAGNKVRVWHMRSGETRRSFVHSHTVMGIAAAPNNQFIVSVSADRTLRIWHIKTGKQVAMLEAHAPLLCCAVSPDGKTILAGDEAGGLHVLDWHWGNLTARS